MTGFILLTLGAWPAMASLGALGNTQKIQQLLSGLRDGTAEGKWTKDHLLKKLLLNSSKPLDPGDE